MSPLVDRIEELSVLEAVLAQARASESPLVVTIEGNYGIGKSALLDAFLAGLPANAAVTRVRAQRLDRIDAAAVESALQNGSEILVVDDAQWCNRPCSDKLAHALREKLVKLVILAFDDEAPALPEPARRLILAPLERAHVERIVRDAAPSLAGERIDAIVANAHGIPYEAVMLAKLGGEDVTAARAIARFIAALPPFSRSVAQMLGLIAAPVDAPLAHALWGEGRDLENALDVLRILVRRDGGRIEFDHPLTAAAVVETIPMKIPLHRRILTAMERVGVHTLGERLLYVEQLLGAGDRDDAQAAALDLAFEAEREGAPYAQLWASNRHLELGEPPDDRFVEFYAQFFTALMNAGKYERAEAIVAHALSQAQRRRLGGVVTLAIQLILAQWAVDRQAAAHASYERYIAAFADADDREQLRAAAPWLRAS